MSDEPTTTPYGAWPSPITAELITAQSTGLGAAVVDGERIIWAAALPERGGQISLLGQDGTQQPTELVGEPYSVRTRVHEYGGGAWTVWEELLVFSNFSDNRLYALDLSRADAAPVPLSGDEPDLRYAALTIAPSSPTSEGSWPDGLLLAVREDHRGEGQNPDNTIVALSLDPDDLRNADGGVVLCSGADFYADPALSADGRLAWVEWDHPAMPWDGTRLCVGTLDGQRVIDVTQQAGGSQESALHPGWTARGDLIFISDRTDWWNLYRRAAEPDGTLASAEPLCPTEAEFCPPPWTLGDHPYLILGDDQLLCTWSKGNLDRLGILHLDDGHLTRIETDAVAIGSVHSDGRRLIAALGYPDAPRTIAVLDSLTPDGHWTTVASSTDLDLPGGSVSIAEAVTWDGADGPVHAWFYPPTHPDHRGSADQAPPMITISHGGPTSAAAPTFNLGTQYWTSRGFAVLDVNYGGSTGYGRPYRERLRGRWGLVDVDDCAQGARAMVEQGRADAAKLAIRGGSAGGYTTLRALTATDVFTAGISFYGVGDLEILARDSHKFESRYLDSMVGPYPEQIDVYHDRSPIYHLDQLSAPILLLQGREDKVVPPNQAELFADAARDAGLPVALIMYDGEGHGFRKPDNVRSSLEAGLYFLGRVFGFTPADELTPIAIDNLR